MINTVIFDIDGTLVDSSEGIIQAVNYAIECYKLKKLDENELKEFVSFSPLKKAFEHYCKVDEELSCKCCETYREYYRKKTMFLTKIYKDIINLLEFLKRNNFKLGVATFKNEENAKLLLRELDLEKYFNYISGAKYEENKTKTDILNTCLENLNSKTGNTIFIGDSHTDAVAALQTGCKFIAVTYGFGFCSQAEAKKYDCVFVAKTAEEIMSFIKGMINE